MSKDDIKDKYKWGLRAIIVVVVAYEYVGLYNDGLLIGN